jgi:hypothetical protein
MVGTLRMQRLAGLHLDLDQRVDAHFGQPQVRRKEAIGQKTRADNIPCHQHGLCQCDLGDNRRAGGPTKSLAASTFCFEFKAFRIKQDPLARGSDHPTKPGRQRSESAGNSHRGPSLPGTGFLVVFSALRGKTRHTHPHEIDRTWSQASLLDATDRTQPSRNQVEALSGIADN